MPGILKRQVAALPFRKTIRGEIEILLITSRKAERFIVPKGWPRKGLVDSAVAAQKAYVEAGVIGKTQHAPIGDYVHWKQPGAASASVMVDVYALEVRDQLEKWPQRKFRRSGWFSPSDAAGVIYAPGLAHLIKNFDGRGIKS